VIIPSARLATLWVLAAAGVAALSTGTWSGTAGPWDDIELWKWTVWLAVAAAVLGLLAVAGPARLRLAAAAAGAALGALAGAAFVRQWWLIGHPTVQGWWTFRDGDTRSVNAPSWFIDRRHSPSDHLTTAGYGVGALLLIALAAAVTLLVRRAADADPAGGRRP